MIYIGKAFLFSSLVLLLTSCQIRDSSFRVGSKQLNEQYLPAWVAGTLDIHHISTGQGNAAYMIFPDGTDMVFDIGDLAQEFLSNHPVMKVAAAKPNNSKQPAEWVANYIKKVAPPKKENSLDYVVISHFHADHFGNAQMRQKKSQSGKFIKSGVTELGEIIPIRNLIDRAYPDYNHPIDLRRYYGKNIANYIDFIKEKKEGGDLHVSALKAGRKDQIVMLNNAESYPEFFVRNVKSNEYIWDGFTSAATQYFNPKEMVDKRGKFNENPLSLALKISYGKFDYFTGGDMTGLQGFGKPYWFDVESPVAKVVSQVDAITLNHHGNRDATNEIFLKMLAPRVIVQQSWISDHPGGEVMHRMASRHIYPGPRDIFSTSMQKETIAAIGTWMVNAYSSFEGHVLIRVESSGSQYWVYVLDDNVEEIRIKAKFGPYISN